MILLLGAGTYVGQAFSTALRLRRFSFVPLSLDAFDYTQFELLFDYVRTIRADLVINAHGFGEELGKGIFQRDLLPLLRQNTLAARVIARVCTATNTRLGHVSSGDIYAGARVNRTGNSKIECDLRTLAMRRLFSSSPARFTGFTEADEPNSTFRRGPCSFYSGTIALAEELLRTQSACYVWRFRLPFNEIAHPANVLSRPPELLRALAGPNSMSHLDECVGAALLLWERCLPYGTYNIVNPGVITGPEVAEVLEKRPVLPTSGRGENVIATSSYGTEEPPRDCILDASKLRRAGIVLRDIKRALKQTVEDCQAGDYEAATGSSNSVPC